MCGEVGEVSLIVPCSESRDTGVAGSALLRGAGWDGITNPLWVLRGAKDVKQGEEGLVHALYIADAGVEKRKEVEDAEQRMPVALRRNV